MKVIVGYQRCCFSLFSCAKGHSASKQAGNFPPTVPGVTVAAPDQEELWNIARGSREAHDRGPLGSLEYVRVLAPVARSLAREHTKRSRKKISASSDPRRPWLPVLPGSCPRLLVLPGLLPSSLAPGTPAEARARARVLVEGEGAGHPGTLGDSRGPSGGFGVWRPRYAGSCSRFRRGRGGGIPRDTRGYSGQLGVWRPRYAGWGCGRGGLF